MLTVSGLHSAILKPASFTVGAGECVAVRGPSGGGKSALLRAVADLDPGRGDVRLNGVAREAMPAPQWRRRVVYVAAESGWWADRVGDHMADPAAAVRLAAALGLPADCPDWPVARLSTGERQRLALVRALVLRPPVLLLDEPTGPLDAGSTTLVEECLRAELARGAAVLLVTHDPAQAERLAVRTLYVEAGRVVADGEVRPCR
ncbi:ABC transporter ATP-binding protein [Azospirillum halopraeferens]|uniref:ABC transporter ATP-binding protein n=1 Tax=Azospirillum halopraeferens TaxID=34010 RepID=UPI000413D6FF|nr:ABC transporter ATP-binding protein [Azospirillum halopraeferens]